MKKEKEKLISEIISKLNEYKKEPFFIYIKDKYNNADNTKVYLPLKLFVNTENLPFRCYHGISIVIENEENIRLTGVDSSNITCVDLKYVLESIKVPNKNTNLKNLYIKLSKANSLFTIGDHFADKSNDCGTIISNAKLDYDGNICFGCKHVDYYKCESTLYINRSNKFLDLRKITNNEFVKISKDIFYKRIKYTEDDIAILQSRICKYQKSINEEKEELNSIICEYESNE